MGARSWLAALALAAACGPGAEAPDRASHLVLVSVDTLRADRIGAYGHADGLTPHADALAAAGLRFEQAYAHSSSTRPSMTSVLTGQLPGRSGVLNNVERLPGGVVTLAETLRASGFATAAFVGNYTLRRGSGLEQGFATYTRGFVGWERGRPVPPENPARTVTDHALAWLARQSSSERIFLWVHFQDPHGPYTPPRFDPPAAATQGPTLPRNDGNSGREGIPAYQWLGHGRLAEYVARYEGEIAETDRQLGRLLAAIEERGMLRDSVVAFVADHGEAFGEGGLYCAHSEGLGEVLIRVPLLIRAPGLAPGVRHDRIRLIDLAPTFFELLGVEAPGLPGRSLLVDVGDRSVVAQLRQVKSGLQWRLVRDGHLELEEDPRGVRTLRVRGPDEDRVVPLGEMADEESRLALALGRLAPWGGSPAGPTLSADEREALRSLGYVD